MDLGFLSRDQINTISSLQQNYSNQKIGQLCIQRGILNAEQVAEILARQYGYEYVLIDREPDPDLIDMVPLGLMLKYRFLPYKLEDDTLIIALYQPRNIIKVTDELEILLDFEISAVIGGKERIEAFLKKIETSKSVLDTVSDDMRLPIVRESGKGEEILSIEALAEEDSPTVKLVNSTILDAINKQASDIHIETSMDGIVIRYRIDGMLYQATDPIDVRHQSAIISRIKVMSELDISEKRIPQDGRFKIKFENRYIDFRVSILPTIFGEDAVIRILDRESLKLGDDMFRLEGMDLPKAELARMRRMIKAPYGMFLMTGPTGSGKTTTLYRALSEIKTKDSKIITIEDPVEYQLKGIVQIQVNEKKGLTFAKGLRSILRHDPDKILVGEIRDAETAQIAIQSALTGHLVFTTVHANRSFEVINRFTHMGIEPFDLMSALNCIIAQRLIRTLCSCKKETFIPEKELLESGINPEISSKYKFYKPKGCEACKGTGFKGRKAIIELVEINDIMREMFIKRAPMSKLKKEALAGGTIFLRMAALDKVFSGETTLDEANRITFVETG